jgi:hypothetical protein
MFDLADAEAQFVGALAHETAHELNNDFLMKQPDYEREHAHHTKLNVRCFAMERNQGGPRWRALDV